MITLTYTGLGSSLYEGGASAASTTTTTSARSWPTGRAAWRRSSSAPRARSAGTRSSSPTRSASTTSTSRSPRSRGRPARRSRSRSRRTPALPKTRIDWPSNVAPTLDARTTMMATRARGLDDRDRQAQLDDRPDPVEGRRHRLGPDPERPGQPRLVDGRRQPRQLHRHLLELRLRAARHRHRGADGTLTSKVTIPDGLGGWHVDPAAPERRDQGAGAVLREAERRRRRLDPQGQGRPAVHDPPQGRRLDAARQHDRGRLRQQLRRLRLRLQLERRRRPQPRRDRRAGDAPDRHVPAALHAAAVVLEHAVRDGSGADLRAGRSRAGARATSCRRSGWRSRSSSRQWRSGEARRGHER